jgi:hypothetical protein
MLHDIKEMLTITVVNFFNLEKLITKAPYYFLLLLTLQYKEK